MTEPKFRPDSYFAPIDQVHQQPPPSMLPKRISHEISHRQAISWRDELDDITRLMETSDAAEFRDAVQRLDELVQSMDVVLDSMRGSNQETLHPRGSARER